MKQKLYRSPSDYGGWVWFAISRYGNVDLFEHRYRNCRFERDGIDLCSPCSPVVHVSLAIIYSLYRSGYVERDANLAWGNGDHESKLPLPFFSPLDLATSVFPWVTQLQSCTIVCNNICLQHVCMPMTFAHWGDVQAHRFGDARSEHNEIEVGERDLHRSIHTCEKWF